MRLVLALLSAAALFAGAPAAAQQCRFDLIGAMTGTARPVLAQFDVSCSPVPDIVVSDPVEGDFFVLTGVPGMFDGPGLAAGTGPISLADLGFFLASSGGGFSANAPLDGSVNSGARIFSLLNGQLFTGTLANPTFTPGVFRFTSDFDFGAVDAELTITELPLPEPTTWASLLLGFGGLGAMLRRGRQVTRARA